LRIIDRKTNLIDNEIDFSVVMFNPVKKEATYLGCQQGQKTANLTVKIYEPKPAYISQPPTP
jgi:hypothetical protein